MTRISQERHRRRSSAPNTSLTAPTMTSRPQCYSRISWRPRWSAPFGGSGSTNLWNRTVRRNLGRPASSGRLPLHRSSPRVASGGISKEMYVSDAEALLAKVPRVSRGPISGRPLPRVLAFLPVSSRIRVTPICWAGDDPHPGELSTPTRNPVGSFPPSRVNHRHSAGSLEETSRLWMGHPTE